MSNDSVDMGRRRVLTYATIAVGAVGAGFVAMPFIASWRPSAKAKAAGGPVEVDISKLEMGAAMYVLWRGQSVAVIRRTAEVLKNLDSLSAEQLRDPNSDSSEQPANAKNAYRSIKPEVLVIRSWCTHLGCSPTYQREEVAVNPSSVGFYCACHGSKYDLAGRVYQGVPAPLNMIVPPHSYTGDNVIVIGVETQGAA